MTQYNADSFTALQQLQAEKETIDQELSAVSLEKRNNTSFASYFRSEKGPDKKRALILQKEQVSKQIEQVLTQLPALILLTPQQINDLQIAVNEVTPLLTTATAQLQALQATIKQSGEKIGRGQVSELGDLLVERWNKRAGGQKNTILSLVADGLSTIISTRGTNSTEDINQHIDQWNLFASQLIPIIQKIDRIYDILVPAQMAQLAIGKKVGNQLLTNAVEFVDLAQDYTQVVQKVFPKLHRKLDVASILSLILQSSMKHQIKTIGQQINNTSTMLREVEINITDLQQEIFNYRSVVPHT